MANRNEELVTRTLDEASLKSLSAKEETVSRESNAWESFLVGTDGDTVGTKENHVSYLDHVEAVNNEPNLLLGGLRFVIITGMTTYGNSNLCRAPK